MVGRINISAEAEAVRQLFMSLERDAKKIKTCWFCGFTLPTSKLANQGYLTGNHGPHCPLEGLASGAEQCIMARKDTDDVKQAAEKVLRDRISNFFAAMTREAVPDCPFPVCKYPFDLGHRLECPLKPLIRVRPKT
jgi:hypothetical protein